VVLVFPALIALITLVVQFAIWEHAEHVAQAAAQDGAQAARLFGATAAAGEARAKEVLAQTGSRIVLDPQVAANRDANLARIDISGSAPRLLPGLGLHVHASAAGPVEAFRPDRAP
jgi:Flp pilus assembly protein TadG